MRSKVQTIAKLNNKDPLKIAQRSINMDTPPTKPQAPATTLTIVDSNYDNCKTLSSASMDLDTPSDTESERDYAAGSKSSCSGCTKRTPSSLQQQLPTPAELPATTTTITITTTATTTQKQWDYEHGHLHWMACYETGCRYQRDEDKNTNLADPPSPPATIVTS